MQEYVKIYICFYEFFMLYRFNNEILSFCKKSVEVKFENAKQLKISFEMFLGEETEGLLSYGRAFQAGRARGKVWRHLIEGI